LYGLIESSTWAWPSSGAQPLAVGVVTLSAFIFVEAHSQAPDAALFRSQTLAGQTADLLCTAALGGAYSFPFNLIQVQGYSATAAGAAFLLIMIMFLLALVRRLGQPLRCKLPLMVPHRCDWIRSVCSCQDWRQLLDDFSSSAGFRYGN